MREGAELSYSGYTNRTEQRLFTDEAALSDYRTRLGIVGWGLFAGADYASADKRFTASVGVRADGADYSARMARFWRQLSPRASVSYQLGKGWSLSGSAGLYYQLPPYTALGFKQDGVLVNEALDYLRVGMFSVGGGWRLRDRLVVSVEGFYKKYGNIPLSVSDGIPLSCKGDDYGVVGNEALRPTAVGRSYGIEAWAAQGRPYYDYGRYNDGRLDAFAKVDLRIDKTFYFRRCMLGFYIDLQNVTGSKLRRPDVLMSTGVVENPGAPAAEQRYRMKYIGQQSGSLIPTLGVTVEF